MSDDDTSHHSHSSSDAPIPYLSPQKEASTTSSSILMAAAYLGQEDLLSQGSSESKGSVEKMDVSNEKEAPLKLEGTNESMDSMDVIDGKDTLTISDCSDALTKSDRSDNKASSGDILARSDRSNASKNFLDNSMQSGASRNNRDASTGVDSLLVSESDDSLRGVVNFAGDEDDSSVSSTPSAPFPLLEEENEDESSNDSNSEQSMEVAENSPLEALSASSVADPLNTNDNTDKNENDDSDGNLSLQPIGLDDDEPATAKSDPIKVSETKTPTEIINNEPAEYNGTISTRNSLRINERTGTIPRRWIADRIDGTVRAEDEKEVEGLPKWKRKPPFFLCLPSPLLAIFPRFFEENSLCVTVGKWGFFGGDLITKRNDKSNNFLRTLIMGHSLLLNVCGLFATILSGLALTRTYPSLLESAPFGKTMMIPTLYSPTGGIDGTVDIAEPVTLYLGLLALGIDNAAASDMGIVVVKFRDFCAKTGTEQFLNTEKCDRCANVSVWVVVGYFLATIAYLPSFAVSVSRLYRNYDTNCSKVSAGIWSLVSFIGYVMVLSCYTSCVNSLYEGEVSYTSKGEILHEDNTFGRDESSGQFLVANFDWKMGVGQILFIIGLCLKLFDLTCNCCIATPAITRSRELQWDYEEGLPTVLSQTQSEGGEN